MAQLKDTVVSGSLRATDSILSITAQFKILNIPTTSNGGEYGPGSDGNVLLTNGTSVYWGTIDKSSLGLGNVENTKLSTWTGSNKIATVGTITTGTWNGTAISASYIGSHNHSTSDLTSGVLGIARGGTNGDTALEAITNLKGPYIASGGTSVTSGKNINTDYKVTGTYYTVNNAGTQGLLGVKPGSGSGIKWFTIGGYRDNTLYQIAGGSGNDIYYRSTQTGSNSNPTWTDWYKFVLLKSDGAEEVSDNSGTVAKFVAVGNSTTPVYITSGGVVQACSAYAGAVPITWDTGWTKGTIPNASASTYQNIFGGVIKDGTHATINNRIWNLENEITKDGHHYLYIRSYGFKAASTTTAYLRLGVTYTNGTEIYASTSFISGGSITGYGSTTFISLPTATSVNYIRFGTRAGTSTLSSTGTVTYETPEQSTQGYIGFTPIYHSRTYATKGDINSDVTDDYSKTRFWFRQYSKTANTIERLTRYETYLLPPTTDGLNANVSYDIYTTKTWPLNRTTVGKYWEVTYGGASCGYYHLSILGPAGTEGCVTLYIGNATAKASAYNTTGRILLYSNGTAGHLIKPDSTAISSTVNHVLPITAGWIATGGNGSSTGVGDDDEPVYLSTAGVLTKCSAYAGGTKVTLNGTAKGATTASFYAPTGAGTAGQTLISTAATPAWYAGLTLTGTTAGTYLATFTGTTEAAATAGTEAVRMKGGLRVDKCIRADKVYNAVWNDYAEYRETDDLVPGACVQEQDNGHMIASNTRLIPGCSIITDTFGYAEGETDKAKTPVAVAGRVLAYTFLPRTMYHAGMAVCSAPGGTIDIMTREEIQKYPDAIIGYVSEIPDYEEWGTGNIKINGRIWIKIK